MYFNLSTIKYCLFHYIDLSVNIASKLFKYSEATVIAPLSALVMVFVDKLYGKNKIIGYLIDTHF